MTTSLLSRPSAARPFAVVSGVFGLAAGVFFVLFFAAGGPGGGFEWAGIASDVLGSVQLVALAPVALALRQRMPAARAVRVACVVVAAAALLTPLIEVVTHQGIWPGAVSAYLIFAWILIVSLTGHRRRSLPRPLTRAGLFIGAGLLVGVVLLLPGLVTPEPLRQAFLAAGIGIGVLAWLAQPVFTLLLAEHVFKEES
ncbi:hypothetical protein [Actinoplanes sp. GCM10030250]|uniref:hypothetical protein n=1 Tax=Actinoplanes sp. GCM10030250 TaxID=3273376 RepID=UPI00361F7226